MAGFLNSTSKKSGLKTSGKKTGTGKSAGGGGGGGTTGAGSKSGSIWGTAKTVTDMVSDNLKNMLGGNKSTVSSAGKTAAPASSATLTGAANALTNRSGTGSVDSGTEDAVQGLHRHEAGLWTYSGHSGPFGSLGKALGDAGVQSKRERASAAQSKVLRETDERHVLFEIYISREQGGSSA